MLVDELESTGVAPDALRGIGELAEVAAVLRHNGYGYFNQWPDGNLVATAPRATARGVRQCAFRGAVDFRSIAPPGRGPGKPVQRALPALFAQLIWNRITGSPERPR